MVRLLCLSLAVASCETPGPWVPTSNEPFLYLVLDPDPQLVPIRDPEQLLFAVLMTTATPELAECRAAERFEMRAATGGPAFAWREGNPYYGNCRSLDAGEAMEVMENGNYHIPETGPADSLGMHDLEYGRRYLLEIDTDGRRIRGSAFVPEAIEVAVHVEAARRRLVWPRVEGAAGYSVHWSTGDSSIQTDTSAVVPDGATWASVSAFDANLYRYMVDEQAGRSGIDAGYGVFGAVSRTTVRF